MICAKGAERAIMGEKSEYYRTLDRKRKSRVSELKEKLPVFVHPFIERCLLDYQVNTVLGYSQDLLYFFEYLIERNPLCRGCQTFEVPEEIIKSLTSADIDDFQAFLAYSEGIHGHSLKPRGIARKMSALRNFFNYQIDHDYLDADPTLKAAKGRREKDKDIIRLDNDEVGRLVSAVEETDLIRERAKKISRKTHLRDTAIITLLLNTGVRVSECVGLDIEDVNFGDNTLTIVRKGGKEARLYFGEDVRNTLRDYLLHERPALVEGYEEKADPHALFLSMKRQRMAVRSVEYMVEKYSKSVIAGKNVSPHSLRRTYGTALYNQTNDIRLVADVLGHVDINTTSKHYAAMDEQHRRMAADVKPYL